MIAWIENYSLVAHARSGCMDAKLRKKRYALVQYFWRLQLELLGDVMLHLREFLVILVMLLASSYARSWAKKGNQGDW